MLYPDKRIIQMENNLQRHDRVLRKRKIEQKPIQEKKNIVISSYNVLKEHNYFRDFIKKNNRWPVIETTYDCVSVELVNDFTDEILKSENVYNEKCDSLPKYLKDSKCSSDIEHIDDTENKPLSLILKIELFNDLLHLHENPNNKFECSLITSYENQLDSEFKLELINNLDNSLNELESETKFIECHEINDSKYSTDLINANDNHFTDIDTQNKTIKHVHLTNHTDIVELKRITESPEIDISEDKRYLSYDVNLIQTHKVANATSQNPENVLPVFEWIDLIYLAIKNSSKEYVSCCEIQSFSRFWFPYFYKKSWIKDIIETLTNYQECFSCECSILAKSCDVWTVNNIFVHTLEKKLKFTVNKYKNQIKSGMKQPDQLCVLLNGYGVRNLGYIQI